MNKSATARNRTGSLFTQPPTGFNSSRDARLLYAFFVYSKGITLDSLPEITGLGRTTCHRMLKLFNMPFPVGYGMTIESTDTGYKVRDWGIIDINKIANNLKQNIAKNYVTK